MPTHQMLHKFQTLYHAELEMQMEEWQKYFVYQQTLTILLKPFSNKKYYVWIQTVNYKYKIYILLKKNSFNRILKIMIVH